MIKKDENVTIISGELTQVLSDMSDLLRVIYRQMKDCLGEESANEQMMTMGRLAVMSDEELDKAINTFSIE